MKNSLKFAGVALVVALMGLSARATPLTYSAAVNGIAVPDATVTATGGALTVASKNGLTILGVSNGASGAEIDVGQSVNIAFDYGIEFKSLTLGLLFNGPEYRDVGEIAASIVNGGSTYELRVGGENSAKWYKDSLFQFDVAGFQTFTGGYGLFTVTNPFGKTLINNLKLTAINVNPPAGGSNSDFGLVAFSSVPDGGTTAMMLGIALLGLGLKNFRRKAS